MDKLRRENAAVEWWNSLDKNTGRKFVYDIWLSQGQPAPVKKQKRTVTGLVQGWNEGQKMLRVFPGGSVIFVLQDQDGNPAGIEGAAVVGTSRAELIETVKRDYQEKYGVDIPTGYKLVYQEIYG